MSDELPEIDAELVDIILENLRPEQREFLLPVLDRWGRAKPDAVVVVLSADDRVASEELRLGLELYAVNFVQLVEPDGGMILFYADPPIPEQVAKLAADVMTLAPGFAVGMVLALLDGKGARLHISEGHCVPSAEPLNWTKEI